MNQKNFEFLKDQLKFTGFGETLENVLKENLQKEKNDFQLKHEVSFGKDLLSLDLNFKKSDQSDMYFFNSYKLGLHKENSKEVLEQTFYINKDSNITVKEAYNLLEGRSVNKDLKNREGEVYNAWLKMDFKEADASGNFKINHYHQNYGYDLEANLAKHPIKELENTKFKDDLINSLKKGNVQSVTFLTDGVEKKQFIEANPQFKTINVYDGSMQRINDRETKEQKQVESKDHSVKRDVTQEGENNQETAQSNKSNTRKKKVSNSL